MNKCTAIIRKQTEIITEAYANYKKNEAAGAQYIYTMGKALTIVKATYKQFDHNHVTMLFEHYCNDDCNFSKAYGYFLISDVKVQDKLETLGLTEIKQGDHQLRRLASMDDQELKKIWKKVTGGDKKKYVMLSELEEYLPRTKPIKQTLLKDMILNEPASRTFFNMTNLMHHLHTGEEIATYDEKLKIMKLWDKCTGEYIDFHK